MWFKNLIIYRFSKPFELSTEELEEKLNEKRFRSCGSQDMSTYGWVPPLGRHGDMLTHAASSFIMICARKEEKILPASVINEVLGERIETIEQEQDRQVFSKEKKTLKDDVIMELLPKAFTKSQNTFAYIDVEAGWMVVDSSSFKKAEDLTSCLRECIGSLPIINPALKNAPSAVMTQWLQQNPPISAPLSLGFDCELRESGDDGGQISIKKQELITDEILAHLDSGMQVSKLALNWDEKQTFVLGDDLIIRKLKFTELIEEKLDEMNAETVAEQFDADFSVMTLSIRELLADLIKALGGESSE